jgi:hypothetical protein
VTAAAALLEVPLGDALPLMVQSGPDLGVADLKSNQHVRFCHRT